MSQPLGLFEGFGIEIEYMIVDRDTLAVRPISDQALLAAGAEEDDDAYWDDFAWSNELVLHVIELKTNGPAKSLDGLAAGFHSCVLRMNKILEQWNAMLLPGAMHPFMNPKTDTHLWPHGYGEVYQTFDRIFGCEGHGWSNLQSVHINLPFRNDEEFARLHAAIRIALPLLPAIAAASPVYESRVAPNLDQRLDVYRHNADRVPSVAGRVIPEPVFTRADYEREILGRIYSDLAPLDPDGVLRHEWANARGAIARFDRNTIEIRVIDAQECPAADMAVARMTVALIQSLCEGELSSLDTQKDVPLDTLVAILGDVIRLGDAAEIASPQFLRAVGCSAEKSPSASERSLSAGEIWNSLGERLKPRLQSASSEEREALTTLLTAGPLAKRILHTLGESNAQPDHSQIEKTWRKLATSLTSNHPLT